MSQTSRGITATGDWVFGAGQQSYLTGNASIQADILTALKVWLGECFFNTAAGVDWKNLLGGKNPQAQAQILIQTRSVILGRSGVVSINSVQAILNSSRGLSIAYNINTIYSTQLTATIPLT